MTGTEACGFWERAIQDPDRPAVVGVDGSRVSRGELLGLVNKLSHGLRARGLGTGDVIAALLPNRVEYLALMLATGQSGMRLLPLNWHLAQYELSHILRDAGTGLLVTDKRYAETARAAADAAGLGPDRRVGLPGFDTFHDWQTLTAGQPDTLPGERQAGQVLAYTSGTTGRPRGVVRPLLPVPPELVAQGAAAVLGPRFDFPLDRGAHLVTAPLYHSAPGGFAVNLLHLGHQIVLTEQFDAAESLRLVERHRVTSTHVAPIAFHRWLALPPQVRSAVDTSSLRQVVHAGAPCPVRTKRAMLEWLGPVVYEYYGSTEGSLISIKPLDWLDHPGTVGRVTPDEVVILDADRNEVPAGQTGMVYFRPLLPFEYLNDPEKTRAAFHEGFATVGDYGHLDGDRWLYLDDRRVDMINSGGVNVYPAEIEGEILQHPAVADVGVIGVSDAEWGHRPVALVELAAGVVPSDALAAEITGWVRDRLAGYKVPRSVEFRDTLPRTPTGKLSRTLLRQQHRDRQPSVPASGLGPES